MIKVVATNLIDLAEELQVCLKMKRIHLIFRFKQLIKAIKRLFCYLRSIHLLKNKYMKTIKITMASIVFLSSLALSSCSKKECHGPDTKKGTHNCKQHDDSATKTNSPT